MTDKSRVIGASTVEGNARRLELLPSKISEAMVELMGGDNIAGGPSAVSLLSNANKKKYVLSRNPGYKLPEGLNDIIICNDHNELVKQYKNSPDELIIVGGLTVFKLFTPHASIFDVSQTNELIPGDLVFDDWEKEELHLISSRDWEGFKTFHYERVLKTDRF